MITRKQYLNNEYTYEAYYSQFVTEAHRNEVQHYTKDTPLKVWDDTYLAPLKVSMKNVGDTLTMAGKVCILKQAMKMNNAQLIEVTQ